MPTPCDAGLRVLSAVASRIAARSSLVRKVLVLDMVLVSLVGRRAHHVGVRTMPMPIGSVNPGCSNHTSTHMHQNRGQQETTGGQRHPGYLIVWTMFFAKTCRARQERISVGLDSG